MGLKSSQNMRYTQVLASWDHFRVKIRKKIFLTPQNFFGPPSQRKQAKKQQKQPKMTLFGPKMACKSRKPQYIHIFWVEKTDFGKTKLKFGPKIRFLEIIYANLCLKWPKIAQNSTFWSQIVL